MAEFRAEKTGFAKQAQDRFTQKYDSVEAAKVLRWICSFKIPTGLRGPTVQAVEKIPREVQTIEMNAFADLLSDGLVLGYLMACVQPEKVQSIIDMKTWTVSERPAFETARKRERIGLFLNFLTDVGVSSASQFQTDQLFEKTGVAQVVIALSQLGMEAQTRPNYSGPPNYWSHKR